MALLLGLDIGTTSIKSVVYDTEQGLVTRSASRPTPVQHPQAGWSEHDPQALWEAVSACIRETVLDQPPAGLAISSMAEAGVLVDSGGQALSPIIAWYDRRSEPQAAWIENKVCMADLYQITGQRASPSFGAAKLLWTRENLPGVFAQGVRWLPVPAYLLWRLTGQAAVDYSIASRTLLFDQQARGWSATLLEALDLPAALLPPAYPGGTVTGRLTAQAAQETGLPASTVCVLGGHDHLCAALAAGARGEGALTDLSGTASALLLLLSHFLPDPRLGERGYASYAYVLKDLYVLKGGLKAAGSAVEWLARQLSGGPGAPAGTPDYAALEAAAWEGVGRRAGPLWLPHLIGSGTPEGDRFSSAALVGVLFEHNQGDLFRGMLEALALWTRHNLEEMQSLTGLAVHSLTLIGGMTRLRLLSQLKADCLNRPVFIPQIPQAAATGAALLAGLGIGTFANIDEAAASLRYGCEQIEPDPAHTGWYEALYQDVYRPLFAALQPVNAAIHRLNS